MKKVILFLVGLWGGMSVQAQLSYDPGKSVVVTGTTTDASNPHGVITFTNTGSSALDLQWNVIENTLNAGWGAVFCTDICYTQVKNSGTYPSLASGKSAFVSIEIQSNGIADTGRLRVVISEVNGTISDTLIFDFQISQGTTGLDRDGFSEAVPFYYHAGRLYFSPSLHGRTVSVYSLTGKQERRFKVASGTMSVADLPSGVYFLMLEDGGRRVVGRFGKD